MLVPINLHYRKPWIIYRVHVQCIQFNTASNEPRHEKICLRGVKQGRRHKCLYGLYYHRISWRLEFGIKEIAYATLSLHLHNRRIKKAYYMECRVYKRMETVLHGLLIAFRHSSMYSLL